MADEKNVRHRFTVPVGDAIVNDWIEEQSNLGFSLRVLIKAFVREYGVQDATCLELGVNVKKKGRPAKQAKIMLSGMTDGIDIGQGSVSDADIPDQEGESIQKTVRDEKSESLTKDTVSETVSNAETDDAMEFFAPKRTVTPKQEIISNTIDHEPEDEGFIDPMSLLN